jgi:hypothetical protein
VSLPLPTPVLREGREVLAVAVGARRKEHALRMFPDLRSEPGYRVEGDRVEEWRLEGFFSGEGALYLYGSAEPGRILEAVLEEEASAVLPLLQRLAAALERLAERGIVLDRVQTDSVFFPDSGGVLLLPPGIMKKVCDLNPMAYKLQVFERVNHPDWVRPGPGSGASRSPSPTAHLSYTLGALAYRSIVGKYPFEADTEEELHNQVRLRQLPSPALLVPGLREDAGRFLLRALGKEPPSPPGLEEWRQALSDWRGGSLIRPLSESERAARAERAKTEGERAARAYGRRVFWQRRGLTVLIVAAVAVVGGILVTSYLRNLLAPPATVGFTPRQVVEAYLQSMNTLDQEMMSDCTVDGAGKDRIREVINVYVLSRVTQGYEGRSNVVAADEWDRLGRPELEPPLTVFGVTGVRLRQVRGEPEPVFDASYTLWAPEAPEESTGAGEPSGGRGEGAPGAQLSSREIRERYFLRMHRGAWAIYRIEPL